MARGEMTRMGGAVRSQLDALGTRLGHILFSRDPAEFDRDRAEFEGMEGRRLRKERLQKLDLEFEPKLHAALIANPELKAHPASPGISLREVKKWLFDDTAKPLLILAGVNGCGKTASAGFAAANHPGPAVWLSASDFVRSHALNADDEDRRLRRRFRKARLRVVDDVGTEGDAERMEAALCEELDLSKQRKWIWTIHMSKEALLTRYPSNRLRSRLRESAIFVADSGPDLRGK